MQNLHSFKFVSSSLSSSHYSSSSPNLCSSSLRYLSHDTKPPSSAAFDQSPSPTSTGSGTTTTTSSHDENQTIPSMIVYEGPFASLALRLKRISITTAAASLVGIPMLMTFGSNLPASGQLAVGGTAIVAATGSTAALSFCFSPYIHTLEWIPVRQCKVVSSTTSAQYEDDEQYNDSNNGSEDQPSTCQSKCQKMLLKATTRNVFSIKVETVFDPDVDVTHDPKTYRPFCNFMVKGKPFFIHPELIKDDLLRMQLLGKEKGILANGEELGMDSTTNNSSTKNDRKTKRKRSDPDDEFI